MRFLLEVQRDRHQAMSSPEQEPVGLPTDTRGRSSVRRNLFGPIDHNQLQQDFQRLLLMSIDSAKRRWDFDFLSDRPASGAELEWEELQSKDVPMFYHSYVTRDMNTGRWGGDAGAAVGSSTSSSASSCSSSPLHSSTSEGSPMPDSWGLKRRQSGFGKIVTASKHRQAAITDFFTVRKRRRLHQKMPARL